MKRLIHLCQTLLLGALLAGCGSGASLLGAVTAGVDSEAGHIGARKEGFTLRVLDESFRYGGSADFTLDVQRSGAETTVSVLASARDLRASYLELEYDADKLHPLESQPGVWPVADRELLHLSLLNEPAGANGRATAYFGAVLPELDRLPGASGEFEVLRLRFVSGKAGNVRLSSKVPNAESSRIPDPAVDTETGTLTFSYYNVGDYNQDGRVAVSDLTPIGIRFGDAVPADSPNSIEAVVDGSSDQKINVQDLTPIGLNFQAKVDYFNVYLGTDLDYQVDNNGAAAILGAIPFAPDGSDPNIERLGGPADVRLSYRAVFPALINPEPAVVWVRPFADQGASLEQGIASIPLPVDGGGPIGDITAPVWSEPATPGIISVTAGDAVANVTWREASDAVSPPVSYHVYYNEGGTVDFSTDSFLTFPEGTLSGEVTGLINGTQYAFAVRAADSATPTPNEDKNTRTLLATPLSTEILPDTVDEDTSYNTPMIVPDSQTTEVQDCAVLTFNNDLTIDGELKAVDCDLYIIVFGDLTVNGKLTLETNQTNPDGDGTDAYSIKVEAHGDVDFSSSSQLQNSGNFYLVDNVSEFALPADVVTDTDGDLNPEINEFTLMNEAPPAPEGFTRQGRSLGLAFNGGRQMGPVNRQASAALFTWNISGNWGQQPPAVPGAQRVVYRIAANAVNMNFSQWTLIGPRGRNAPDVVDCNASGGQGGDAYRLRIHSAELVNFDSCNIGLSEGGRGGAANAPVCCNAFAAGGNGGQPGRFRVTSFTGIGFSAGETTLDPGKGGDGGPATAIGTTGLDGCPAENGCQANAEGGNGADVYFGLFARGEIGGMDKLRLLSIRAGNGGNATATGGDGGQNTCSCGGAGGSGGAGVALGGDGGDATFGSLLGAVDGAAASGDGGNANATGGSGTDGGDCLKEDEGGDGGDGGAASCVGGPAGAADGLVPLTQGADGSATAIGGNGGAGGDGCNAGSAGSGGLATAVADDSTQTDGTLGVPGETVCPVEWFVTLPSLLPPDGGPGPDTIADGFSGNADLFDTGSLQVVGTVPFVWHVPVVGGATWDKDLITNDVFFQMNNTSIDQTISLEMDFSQVDLDSGQMPLGLLSSRLFIRDNHELTATSLGAYLDLRGVPDLNTLFLEPLDEVIHLPGGEPIIQNFDFGGIVPNPIYRIACPPQWTTAVQLIYIIDP